MCIERSVALTQTKREEEQGGKREEEGMEGEGGKRKGGKREGKEEWSFLHSNSGTQRFTDGLFCQLS